MSAIWDREEEPSKVPKVDPYPPDYDAKANEEARWGKMQFSERGIPILTIREKCDSLAICLENGDHEDAEGHIWDLLNLAMGGFIPNKWAEQMIGKYGNPTPVRNSASD